MLTSCMAHKGRRKRIKTKKDVKKREHVKFVNLFTSIVYCWLVSVSLGGPSRNVLHVHTGWLIGADWMTRSISASTGSCYMAGMPDVCRNLMLVCLAHRLITIIHVKVGCPLLITNATLACHMSGCSDYGNESEH